MSCIHMGPTQRRLYAVPRGLLLQGKSCCCCRGLVYSLSGCRLRFLADVVGSFLYHVQE